MRSRHISTRWPRQLAAGPTLQLRPHKPGDYASPNNTFDAQLALEGAYMRECGFSEDYRGRRGVQGKAGAEVSGAVIGFGAEALFNGGSHPIRPDVDFMAFMPPRPTKWTFHRKS